ncbi:AzlD domain-containing protein (plasmid) [Limimaricola variabilis]|uniref:AzlD domain-containing protein n=1 Tax=Limimaricola variabilis TaxID=1492771 RepID=UPI002AC9E256|nr:AzlD domain-containing protein [Limimaricola variabilis]WPY96255.1 AzlD domain-containing protein [Limimaricola variabilis]
MIGDFEFWSLTLALGLGTFLIRFSFLGLLGGRQLPGWLLLHLKYVGVAVFPALIVPAVLWPAATSGETQAPRVMAALVAVAAGLRFGPVGAIVAGLIALYGAQALS